MRRAVHVGVPAPAGGGGGRCPPRGFHSCCRDRALHAATSALVNHAKDAMVLADEAIKVHPITRLTVAVHHPTQSDAVAEPVVASAAARRRAAHTLPRPNLAIAIQARLSAVDAFLAAARAQQRAAGPSAGTPAEVRAVWERQEAALADGAAALATLRNATADYHRNAPIHAWLAAARQRWAAARVLVRTPSLLTAAEEERLYGAARRVAGP